MKNNVMLHIEKENHVKEFYTENKCATTVTVCNFLRNCCFLGIKNGRESRICLKLDIR